MTAVRTDDPPGAIVKLTCDVGEDEPAIGERHGIVPAKGHGKPAACARPASQAANSASNALASIRSRSLGKPAVDRSEKIASLLRLALVTPEPRHAGGGAEFPGFCLLRASDRERPLEGDHIEAEAKKRTLKI